MPTTNNAIQNLYLNAYINWFSYDSDLPYREMAGIQTCELYS